MGELERRFQLDDAPGPARPLDDAQLGALIAGALAGAGFGPPPTGGAPERRGDGGPPATGSGPAMTGAGGATATGRRLGVSPKLVVLAGGAAALAIVAAWLAMSARFDGAPGASTAPVASATSAAVRAATPAPAAGPVSSVVPGAPDPAPVPPAAAAAALEDRAAPSDDDSVDVEMEPEPGRRAPIGRPARQARGAAAPEDLLAAANAARAAHRWQRADALYARVAAIAPGTLASQTALVASASLHLEHLGDPGGATRRFRAALAAGPRGPLAEDARWGLAEAARASRDPAAERRALDELLAHHPGSPHAPRARSRRTALGAAP